MGNESHDFIPELGSQEGPQPGPSWARPNWLREVVDSDDDLTQALDPTQMKLAVAEAAKKTGKPSDAKSIEAAAADSISAMLLIRLYRVRGHLAADLDPLGRAEKPHIAELDLSNYGLSEADLDSVFNTGTLFWK